jgi:hypothetical protein
MDNGSAAIGRVYRKPTSLRFAKGGVGPEHDLLALLLLPLDLRQQELLSTLGVWQLNGP